MNRALEILQTGTEEEREIAAERLMTLGKAVMPSLKALLISGDSDTRWWATRALAEIPELAAAQTLIDTLSDPDEDVQVCAVMGLGERREASSAAQDGLLALLRRSNAYVQRHVGDALSKIGEAVVPGLLLALEDDEPAVRVQAARALVRIESHQAIPSLIKALDDPEPAVEHYAWDALQRMGVGVTLLFKP